MPVIVALGCLEVGEKFTVVVVLVVVLVVLVVLVVVVAATVPA